MAAKTRIDKLVLRVPYGHARDGQRLAAQVAAALAAYRVTAAPADPVLKVRLTDDPDASDEALARRIAAGIARALTVSGD